MLITSLPRILWYSRWTHSSGAESALHKEFVIRTEIYLTHFSVMTPCWNSYEILEKAVRWSFPSSQIRPARLNQSFKVSRKNCSGTDCSTPCQHQTPRALFGPCWCSTFCSPSKGGEREPCGEAHGRAPRLMDPISIDFCLIVFLSGRTVWAFLCSASVKAPVPA